MPATTGWRISRSPSAWRRTTADSERAWDLAGCLAAAVPRGRERPRAANGDNGRMQAQKVAIEATKLILEWALPMVEVGPDFASYARFMSAHRSGFLASECRERCAAGSLLASWFLPAFSH